MSVSSQTILYRIHSIVSTTVLWTSATLAETWCTFGGRGRSVSAENFFAPPPNAKFEGWRGTHCLLETNVGKYHSVKCEQ